jgi:hypothetical protein
MKEDFVGCRCDDPKIENVKIIVINAPCSKSALMNPMEFLFEEGEGIFTINYQRVLIIFLITFF